MLTPRLLTRTQAFETGLSGGMLLGVVLAGTKALQLHAAARLVSRLLLRLRRPLGSACVCVAS